MAAIGGHQRPYRGGSDDWITPREVLAPLGVFDTDPCCSITQPWLTAINNWSIEDDGLSIEWRGRVWLNPPYGPQTGSWLKRLAEHGNGIALIFARTETEMFHEWGWKKATAMLFLRGRLHFHHPDGKRAAHNAGGPSVLIAYGQNNADCLRDCGLAGQFVQLRA